MTITLSAWWLHIGVTMLWAAVCAYIMNSAGDYDFGAPILALLVTLAYAMYWIVYLALT